MAPLRVLELYSGIGGMHQALKGTGDRPPPARPSLFAAAAAALPCAPPSPARLLAHPPLRAPSSRWDPDPWEEAVRAPSPPWGVSRCPPPRLAQPHHPTSPRHSLPVCRGRRVPARRWGWCCLTGLPSGAGCGGDRYLGFG